MGYLDELLAEPTVPTELQTLLQQLKTQFEKRLWHQLSLTLQDTFALDASRGLQTKLYLNFVAPIAAQLNQIKLVQLASTAAGHIQDPEEALAFLQPVAETVDHPESQDAHILVSTELAHHQLLLGRLDESESTIAWCTSALERLGNVNPVVYASYYRVLAELYKAKAEFSDFYKTSLLYLACINPEHDLTPVQSRTIAYDLALAALLGSSIYSFGELLLHPILESLHGTDKSWIKDLLLAYSQGSIGKFEVLLGHFQTESLLQDNYAFLRQKICLMALIEAVFGRPAGQRVISFGAIAIETSLPPHEVEHLLMKAMSLKLIEGHIDQVHQSAHVDWVQPRVLDPTQIDKLNLQLQHWAKRVTDTTVHAQNHKSLVL